LSSDDRLGMGNFFSENDWKVTLLLIQQKSLILALPYQCTTVKPVICSNAFQWVIGIAKIVTRIVVWTHLVSDGVPKFC
jgi:hypothetical protein